MKLQLASYLYPGNCDSCSPPTPHDKIDMADTMDVDPPTAAAGEPKGKTKDDKKRFEVKKVRLPVRCIRIRSSSRHTMASVTDFTVERRCSVGMG